RKLNELYRRFIHIVGKGFEDISPFVNHAQPARGQRQQRPLQRDGKQNNQKDNMKQVMVGRNRADNRHNRENDRSRPPQPRKGNQQLLPPAAAERRQQQKDRRRPRRKGQEQHNADRRQHHSGHLA